MFPFGDTIPTKRWEIVTFVIVAINLFSFLWLQHLPQEKQAIVAAKWGFVPARVAQLSDPNKVVAVPVGPQIIPNFWPFAAQPVQPHVNLPPNPRQILASAFTCMFLHGGWWHLIGNMWFLLIFGNNIEDRLGHLLYAIFYVLGGLAATATHWAIDPSSTAPVIGASGAIAAVLGAYAVTFPHARIRTLLFLFVFVTVVELPAYLFLALWFGGQLLSAFGTIGGQMDGGVAWWAHVGGFVFGAVLMPVFSTIAPPDPEVPAAEPEGLYPHSWPQNNDDRYWV